MSELNKLNIKKDITFGQRIGLGVIAGSDLSELAKFEGVFNCLHGWKPVETEYKDLIDYFTEIIEGLKYWIECEATQLKYEPNADEEKAGIRELYDKVGNLSTPYAMGKTFGIDPDIVLTWKYAKVFGFLVKELEDYKFNVRYNKILEAKYKK